MAKQINTGIRWILDSNYQEAINRVSFLQTWPGHFLVKKTETEIILNNFNFNNSTKGIGLEIGCGNAFQASLMANFVQKFIATDLFSTDSRSHTVGMHKAKTLVNALDNRNILLVSCSSKSLPFSDNYFDFIFSSSTLEHIDDKVSVLKEMRRVLKDDGHLILIVPTHMPCIYAFIHVYLYCLARIIKLIFQSSARQWPISQERPDAQKEISLLKRFRKNHPAFPFPEPHGCYKNIAEEILSQLPFRWVRLLQQSGFTVKKSIAICLLPWLLFEPFSTLLPAKIYALTKDINIRLANLKFSRYLSYLIGIEATKDL